MSAGETKPRRPRGPDKMPRRARQPDGLASRSRHANHDMGDPDRVMALKLDNPAVVEKRTLFPTTVASAVDTPRLLVDGANQRKLGHRVVKGPWKGFPIYALTLEERATCPSDCYRLRDCYGNGMQFARRHQHGREMEYRLAGELAELQDMHVGGFVVRLHILGDFYDLAYVALWRRWMDQFPSLHVFGYTAWPFPAGTVSWRAGCAIDERQQLAALIDQMNLDFGATPDRPARWAIRFSTPRPFPGAHGQVTTINRRPEAAVVPEGIVCPAETGLTENCGTCALCWSPAAQHRPIVFVLHGRKARGSSNSDSSSRAPSGHTDEDARPAAASVARAAASPVVQPIVEGPEPSATSSAPAETAGGSAVGVSSQTSPAPSIPIEAPADFSERARTRLPAASDERAERKAAQVAEAKRFIGVYAATKGYTFFSSIIVTVEVDGVAIKRSRYLGSFSAAEEAARAYDAAARPLGRKLNFPDEPAPTPVNTDTPAESTAAHPGRTVEASHSPSPAISPAAQGAHASPRTAQPVGRFAVPAVSKIATAEPAPLMRAAPPPGRSRALEQAEIDRFIAERGVRVLPPTGNPDSRDAIAAARAELEGDAHIPPGTPVTCKAGASRRRRGVVDAEPSGDPDRISVRVTDPSGATRIIRPLKASVRPCK